MGLTLIFKQACWKGGRGGAQRAKFAKKVHKPPLGVNVINFELNLYTKSVRLYVRTLSPPTFMVRFEL